MAISDPVADMLTKIRNASLAKHEKVEISISKMKLQIVKILKNEGYIKNFKKVVNKDGTSTIRVFLKYDEKQNPVLRGISRISTPGPFPRRLDSFLISFDTCPKYFAYRYTPTR